MKNNLGLLLQKRALINPDLEAVIDLDKNLRLTYRQLDNRVNQTANLFSSMGIKKGDRVGVLLMNGIEFVESTFGLAKIGAVSVPRVRHHGLGGAAMAGARSLARPDRRIIPREPKRSAPDEAEVFLW